MSLPMTTTKEVPSKESTKDLGQKTMMDNVFIFKVEQSLVRKSSYLSENQSVFLREDTQSTEEQKIEAVKSEEPSYWTLSQRTQAFGGKTTSGLGSKQMKKNLTNVMKLRADPHPLVDRVGEEVTQRHLKKLISSQMILKPVKIREHIRGKGLMTKEVLKDFLLYFLENGTVKWMDLDTLLQNKRSEELAYVKFFLEKRAEVKNGRNIILS